MTKHVANPDPIADPATDVPALLLGLGELGVAALGLLVALAALGCVHAMIAAHREDRS